MSLNFTMKPCPYASCSENEIVCDNDVCGCSGKKTGFILADDGITKYRCLHGFFRPVFESSSKIGAVIADALESLKEMRQYPNNSHEEECLNLMEEAIRLQAAPSALVVLEKLKAAIGERAIEYHQKGQKASPKVSDKVMEWSMFYEARDALRTLNHDVICEMIEQIKTGNNAVTIDDLIRINNELLEKYPDDFALKLNAKQIEQIKADSTNKQMNTPGVRPEGVSAVPWDVAEEYAIKRFAGALRAFYQAIPADDPCSGGGEMNSDECTSYEGNCNLCLLDRAFKSLQERAP